MRIGVDVRCLMEGKRTGVEEYTINLLSALARLPGEDTFVLFYNSARPVRLPPFPTGRVEVRGFRYPNTIFNLGLKSVGLPHIDRLLGGVDVFFSPSVRLTPLASAPLVVTFHDLSYVRHPEYFSVQRRIWHRVMAPEVLAADARAIIAVSDATRNDLLSLYHVPRKRIRVIPSGVGEQFTPRERSDDAIARVRTRYGLPERFILFLGTIEPRKNIEGLLAAYRALRDAGEVSHTLVIAGRRGWKDEAIFARIRSDFSPGEVVLTGFVSDVDKPALYAAADLFVYPSFYEGFGFPPLEALCCGTPVITSTNAAIPEVVGEFAHLVEPHATTALVDVMGAVLASPERVPPRVSEELHRRFSWKRAAERTRAVFQEVVG